MTNLRPAPARPPPGRLSRHGSLLSDPRHGSLSDRGYTHTDKKESSPSKESPRKFCPKTVASSSSSTARSSAEKTGPTSPADQAASSPLHQTPASPPPTAALTAASLKVSEAARVSFVKRRVAKFDVVFDATAHQQARSLLLSTLQSLVGGFPIKNTTSADLGGGSVLPCLVDDYFVHLCYSVGDKVLREHTGGVLQLGQMRALEQTGGMGGTTSTASSGRGGMTAMSGVDGGSAPSRGSYLSAPSRGEF